MSSNKTVIPGMEEATSINSGFNNNQKGNFNPNPGTYVPNSYGPGQASSPLNTNSKPIVGFLYSISKSNTAEYWPLRIGSNTIGRSKDSDVCLGEATVSDQHAVLVIRQMKNPEKIIASICDARSTCGTMINGESLGFDPKECFNGDIITIGEHYDLFFILIDAKQLGLNVCKDFIPTQQQAQQYMGPQYNQYETPKFHHGTHSFEQPASGHTQPVNGTQGFNDPMENKPATKPGGTIFM